MEWKDFVRSVGAIIRDYPAFWPLLIFPLLLPVFALLSGRESVNELAGRYRTWAFMWCGVACLCLFVSVGAIYLSSTAFWDAYESREASVAALYARGGMVYPDPTTQERYAAPYGPMLYVVLACSQFLFGPGGFSTKLPGVAAALLAVGVFWEIVRRQCASARAAWSLAGLEAALLLAFRQQIFWSKADPLILLLVTIGLGVSLGRARHWPLWFGLCAGLATDLKLHAAAYFLPALVAAYQTGWRARAFFVSGATAAVVAALPFVAGGQQFSLANHFGFLQITAREGFGFDAMFGFVRWAVLLGALVFLSDRLVRHTRGATPHERRLRWYFRASLVVAAGLVAVPGCSLGGGQGHLMPLIPACLLAAGDRFVRGATARWDRSPNVFWRTAVYSSLAACGLVAVQTTWRMAVFHARSEAAARACRADIRQILARYPDRTVLTGSGGDDDTLATGFRQEAVFVGHPVGLDAAALMDYQQGGLPEPDLSRLAAEMHARHRRPLLWLLPRGSTPFSQTNLYDRTRAVFSPRFRHEFRARYERREQGAFYDLYFPRTDAF